MWKIFSRPEPSPPELPEAESLQRELNELRTRVERLELDSAERQVEVLNAVGKAMTALNARERMAKAREKDSQDDPGSTNGDEDIPQHPPRSTSAHLARRFRGF